MSSTGTMISRSSDLWLPASTMVTGRGGRFGVTAEAAEEARDLVERALGGREPDALRRTMGDGFEPLEREREVRAALGGRERVDLVDDDELHRPQRLARLRGEHEVERLGCGDEDVGRSAQERLAGAALGVAGAQRHARLVEPDAEPLGRERDAAQRRPQVLLDVDRRARSGEM